MNEGQKAVKGLVVPGGDAARILELVEEAVDAVAQSVEQRVDRTLDLAVDLGRDYRIGAVEPRPGITVESTI